MPTIMAPPKIESRQQLLDFFAKDKIKPLRPLGKVVAISHSIKGDMVFTGVMTRKRIGKKEDN